MVANTNFLIAFHCFGKVCSLNGKFFPQSFSQSCLMLTRMDLGEYYMLCWNIEKDSTNKFSGKNIKLLVPKPVIISTIY